MLEDLDTIPWSQLTHAYGSAEDVPGLLRELRTPAPGKEEEKEPDPSKEEDEEAPLWCLFGNIWHQGTVYEAMAYAVPFLLELVSDSQTPERTGILQLLASIAKSKFTTANVREPGWAVKAHAAVAAGFAVLAAIAKEETEVRLAAAHVLAFLPEQAEVVEPLLQDLLHAESGPAERAGFLLLLGQLGGKSDAALAMLTSALQSADLSQRWAAAYSMALLRPQPLSDFAREAIVEAILAEDFEENFRELPWDAPGDIDCEELYACLDASSREQAATACIGKIESGKATHATISIILGLLFPMTRAGGSSRLKAGDLSSLQINAIRAMARAMEGGKRIFSGAFPQWGLPDTRREWRDLAAGRDPAPMDMTLPILGEPANPRRAIRADKLKPKQRVLHRTFGLGTVIETKRHSSSTELTVDFNDEGITKLVL